MTSVETERSRLASRLAHRLESSVLLAREMAERPDLDQLPEHLEEVARRARALARCCAVGSEAAAALRDALADWMGPDASWRQADDAFEVEAAAGHVPPEAAELGEPLVRLLAAESGAEVLSWSPRRAVIRA